MTDRQSLIVARPAKPPADPLWWPARLMTDLRWPNSATARLWFLDAGDTQPSVISTQEKTVWMAPHFDGYDFEQGMSADLTLITPNGAQFLPAGTDVMILYHAQHKRWYAFQPWHTQHVTFVLKAELVEFSGDSVAADLYYWSGSALSGGGAFVDSGIDILVADKRNIGYYGPAGRMGAAELMPRTTAGIYNDYRIGVIYDLSAWDYYPAIPPHTHP